MYFFGARWYDAEAGRFAGVDPLVANAGDPQDLNAYGYVRNDPVNLIDPNGMEYIETITITGTRGGGGNIATESLSMGISAPRFSIASVGGGLYIAADGYLTGTQNSQQQDECCTDDQGDDGDSSQEDQVAGAVEDLINAEIQASIDRLTSARDALEELVEADEEALAELKKGIADDERYLSPQQDESHEVARTRAIGNAFGGREFMRNIAKGYADKLNRRSILEPRIASRRTRIGEIDREIAGLRRLKL
jgi:hypothetical protein